MQRQLRAANSPRDIFTFAALVLARNQSAIKKDAHKLGLTPQLLGSQDMSISFAPEQESPAKKVDQTTKATEPKQSKACFRESCEHHLGRRKLRAFRVPSQ